MYKTAYDFGRVRNKIYITNRQFEKHFFKMYDGFGISDDVLNSLKRSDTKYVLIITDNCDYLFHLEQYINGKCYNNEVRPGIVDSQKFVSIRDTIELPKHKK